MPDRPNVLVVLTDQMRAQAMGCAGNDDVQTPTLDRFASEGRQFTRALSPDPVCSPTRASILTGQYPHAHGEIENHLRLEPDRPTLAERFAADGYRTGYVGKWHLDGDGKPGYVPPGPRRRGFDYWEGFNRGHDYHRGHPRFTEDGDCYWEAGYQPAVQTDLALDFLDEQAGAADPFFLMVSWGPPHTPFDAPDAYSDRYDPAGLNLRPNVPDEMDTPDLRAALAEYYALVTSLDDQFERLLDALDARGVADDTVVVFLSDHGEMLGSHGRQRKNYPFAESVRVPLLVRYPGVVDPGESDAPVSLVDLLPTLLGLTGGDPPEDLHGRDLSPHLRGDGPPAPDRDAVYVEGQVAYDEAWRSVHTDRYALTVDRRLDARYLFDLQADPYEQENLVDDPEYADVVDRLRDRLLSLASAYDDRHVMATDVMRRVGNDPLEPRGRMFEE